MIKFLLTILSLYSCTCLAAESLQQHPSPYLRLHANDAVHWRVWDQTVLEQARQQNKLIFISIGYFSCHWCHVMRDESFTDAEVAEYLNRDFISVKVDRELNPALDHYLMDFTQKTRGYGGWPLNVFVTPDGYPLLGLVYLPKKELLSLLKKLQQGWLEDRDELFLMALKAFEFSKKQNGQRMEMPSVDDLQQYLLDVVQQFADELQGGIGNQSQTKFPRPALLLALLELYQQQKPEWLKEFLLLTLDQMATRGLHDAIGGGFFRYTIDPDWNTPHFEKMLYTNAGLARVYSRAYEVFGRVQYLLVAEETVDFMLREMRLPNGGFASALSAHDSEGVEGGSYLWQRDEISQVLSSAQWHRLGQVAQLLDVEGQLLPAAQLVGSDWKDVRQRLYEKRRQNPPQVDSKLLPSWNGYMLSALAKLVQQTGNRNYRLAGEKLYALLLEQYRQGLYRTAQGVNRRYLEDFVFVAQGVRDWQQLYPDNSNQALVFDLVSQVFDLFLTEQGWRLSDTQLLPLPSDLLIIADAQLPSPDSVILTLCKELKLVENAQYASRLQMLMKYTDTKLNFDILSYASHVIYQSSRKTVSDVIQAEKNGKLP